MDAYRGGLYVFLSAVIFTESRCRAESGIFRETYVNIIPVGALSTFVARTPTGLVLADTEPSVELQFEPAGDILEGDTLVITCRVTGKGRFDVIRLVRNFDDDEAVISTNQYIDDVFKASKRYFNEDFSQENGVTTIVTRIEDVEGRDGGQIGCELLPAEISAEEDINIFVRPKTVELLHQDVDGEWVRPVDGAVIIKKGTMSGVMCKVVVDGTSTPSVISLEMDGRDVSSMFQDEETFDQSLQDGYKHVVRTTDWKYITDEANVDHHGKILRCSAELPEFPAVTDEAQLEVRYSPQLDCDARWSAKIGSQNVRIVCRGRMYPPPVYTNWSFGKRPNRTILQQGETRDNLTAQQSDLGDSTYEFALAISEVTEGHFRKYKLEVDNGVGSTSEASIRFHEEEEIIEEEVEIRPTSPSEPAANELDPGYKFDNGVSSVVIPSTISLLIIGILSTKLWTQ